LHSDYNVYMDIHQAVNLTIKAEFERRGIRFALPTQTLLFPGTAPAADS
jgi:small-conductance mechanosensitive channel